VPEVNIAAETRDEFGKGAARRIRREGRVPAVLYGHGTETRHLTLPGHDLMRALRTISTAMVFLIRQSVLSISIDWWA
jgi:large subunit ribosomal protein L25